MSLIQLKDVYKIYAEGQENQVNALDERDFLFQSLWNQ